MDNTTRARKLAKWLRRQEWYNAYWANLCACYSGENDYDLVQSFADGHEGEFTIEQAFNWKGTPEGFEYWERANNELKIFINNLIN